MIWNQAYIQRMPNKYNIYQQCYDGPAYFEKDCLPAVSRHKIFILYKLGEELVGLIGVLVFLYVVSLILRRFHDINRPAADISNLTYPPQALSTWASLFFGSSYPETNKYGAPTGNFIKR